MYKYTRTLYVPASCYISLAPNLKLWKPLLLSYCRFGHVYFHLYFTNSCSCYSLPIYNTFGLLFPYSLISHSTRFALLQDFISHTSHPLQLCFRHCPLCIHIKTLMSTKKLYTPNLHLIPLGDFSIHFCTRSSSTISASLPRPDLHTPSHPSARRRTQSFNIHLNSPLFALRVAVSLAPATSPANAVAHLIRRHISMRVVGYSRTRTRLQHYTQRAGTNVLFEAWNGRRDRRASKLCVSPFRCKTQTMLASFLQIPQRVSLHFVYIESDATRRSAGMLCGVAT